MKPTAGDVYINSRHRPPANYLPDADRELDRTLRAIGEVVARAEQQLAANPELILGLLTVSEFRSALPRVLDDGSRVQTTAAAAWGKAVERLAFDLATQHPQLRDRIDYQRTVLFPDGRCGYIDLLVRLSSGKLVPVDITTRRGRGDHESRQYGDVLHQFCYDIPRNVREMIARMDRITSSNPVLQTIGLPGSDSESPLLDAVIHLGRAFNDLAFVSSRGEHDKAHQLLSVHIPRILNKPHVQDFLENNRELASQLHSSVMRLDMHDREALALSADRALAIMNPRWNPLASRSQQAADTIDIVMKQYLLDPRTAVRLPSWRAIADVLAQDHTNAGRAQMLLSISRRIGRSPALAFCMAVERPDELLTVLVSEGTPSARDRWRLNDALPLSATLACEKLSEAMDRIAAAPTAKKRRTAITNVRSLFTTPDIAALNERHPFLRTLVEREVARYAHPTVDAPPLSPAPPRQEPLFLADLGWTEQDIRILSGSLSPADAFNAYTPATGGLLG